MPDNLSISISADSTKARAEFELMKAKAGELRKELGALTREAQRTGGGQMTPQITQTTRALQAAELGMRAYRRETAATAETNLVASRSFRETSTAIAQLSRAAGLAIPGIRALRAGLAALVGVEIVRGIKSGIDSLNELNNTAARLRVPPEFLRQVRLAAAQIGQDAAVADRIIGQLNKNTTDAILKQRELGRSAGGVDTLRGGMGRRPTLADVSGLALRGGQPGFNLDEVITQAGGILPFILGRPFNEKKVADEWRKIAQRILALRDPAIRAELSQRTYGATFEEAFGTPTAPGTERRRAEGTLPEVKGQTDAQKATLAEINKNVADIGEAWQQGNQGLAVAVGQTAIAASQLRTWQNILSGVSSTQAAEAAAMPFAPAGTSVPVEAGLQAAGGLIRGPGTGTSDSIPAWLSNGEYVINASSVRRLGTGFLHSLNNFALGGLVGPPPMRFAAGGMVPSASGQPVHLHLGTHSFALSGASNVVSALVVEANRQHTRSAGVKPSWYGR
jgi:hypothetical protein